MLQEARDARELSDCPRTHFRAGACVLTAPKVIFRGWNFELPHGPSLCAERIACRKAMIHGFEGITDIAVVAKERDGGLPTLCHCCTRYIEFFFKNVTIHLATPELAMVKVVKVSGYGES